MAFTFFFRDMHTLQIIEQKVIPQLRNRRYLNVWDAGCATGAEPYSLAMLFRENMGEFLFRNLRIYATDIDHNFGDIIRKGAYRDEEVRSIPAPMREKYFAPADGGSSLVVTDALRSAVLFQHHDLTTYKPIRDGFCLIVCKNVLLHLKREQVVEVIKMFHEVLSEGGFFVTEQTQKLPAEVNHLFQQITNDGQVFQKI